jgi:hypothetical protein
MDRERLIPQALQPNYPKAIPAFADRSTGDVQLFFATAPCLNPSSQPRGDYRSGLCVRNGSLQHGGLSGPSGQAREFDQHDDLGERA